MKYNRKAIYAIAFFNGAIVMGFEILGSRVLAPTFGNSIFVWGSIIGVFMAGLAAGYYLGGWLGDRGKSIGTLALMLIVPGVMVAAFPVYGFVFAEFVFDMNLGPRGGPLVACMGLFFLPTVFMGAVSPYSISLLLSGSHRAGREVGGLYARATVGSIVGTLGTAFYLVVLSGTRASLMMMGAGLILLAVAAVTFAGKRS